ncbi:O-antigen ligase family protein [Phormidium tenue FACHB-886]|nr:O-antigen ligase family protein [Phormidium tenue FACHB-886]
MESLPRGFDRFRRIFRFSIIALPYLSYVSVAGLILDTLYLVKTYKRSSLDPLIRNGLLLICGLMLISSALAFERGEAFLQLTNYFPFFLMFAVLPYFLKGIEQLERLALDVVLASIPLNLLAFVEYVLRSPWITRPFRRNPFIRWVRSRPHEGRAMLMFGHPNAMAAYLVVVFGLGLGLILCYYWGRSQPGQAQPGRSARFSHPAWLYAGTFLNLLGIFSAGSRNGLLVAISQLILFSLLSRASRAIWMAGLVSVGGILVGVAGLGIGGRAQLLGNWANESRLLIWGIALDLIRERPLFGWGLGNYKFQYPLRIAGLNVEETYVGHPHSLWLMLGCEAGLLVTIVFTGWVGLICFRAARRLQPQDKHSLPERQRAILLGFLVAFWGCIAFSLFDVPLFDARLNVMGWLMLTGLYVLGRQEKAVAEPALA